MRTASDLATDLLPLLPGVPQPRMERALVRVAQELCRRARCWTVWTDPVTVRGAGEFDMPLPLYAQVVVVERMTVDGQPRAMWPFSFSPRALEDIHGARVSPGRLTFTVADGVPAGAVVRFRVALAPTDDAPGVEDVLFDPYSALLAQGVCAVLMADPGQPWSNADLAGVYAARFDTGAARARLSAWRGVTDLTPRARVLWC